MTYHIRLKLPASIQDNAAARKALTDLQAWLNADVKEQRAIIVDRAKPQIERRYVEADLDRISVMVAEWDDSDAETMIDRAELWEAEREVRR